MRRARRAFRLLVISALTLGAWAVPACKSNEVNQVVNEQNNFMSVGATGATVPGPDNTSVIVPAGALQDDTLIGISVAEEGDYVAPPSEAVFTSKVYAFLPHGQFFDVDATIVLPGTLANHDVWHAEEGEGWTKLARVKNSDGFVRFRASGFSFFALSAVAGAEPVGDSGVDETNTGGPDGAVEPPRDAAPSTDSASTIDTSTGGRCVPMCPSGPLANEQPCR